MVQWTATAMNRLRQIKSEHFTDQETMEYKMNLIRRVERRSLLWEQCCRLVSTATRTTVSWIDTLYLTSCWTTVSDM